MTDLQVPPDEFSYGHSKIFIRNPRTVQNRNVAAIISPARFDISAFRRTIFSQRNACSTGWAAHAPPLLTSAISMQSALCKHMVSLNSVTWEMSSFSRPSKTLQMLKPAVLEWTFPPPGKRPNNACNNTASYQESNYIFLSHLLISITRAAVKSTHGAEWILICASRRFLFGCLRCRSVPVFVFWFFF